mgnify:CR=1 FL=1
MSKGKTKEFQAIQEIREYLHFIRLTTTFEKGLTVQYGVNVTRLARSTLRVIEDPARQKSKM